MMRKLQRGLWIGLGAWLAAGAAAAFDGGMAVSGPGPTYYEMAVDDQAVASAELTKDGAASGGLPTALYVVDAEGGVTYRPLGDGAWQVEIAVAERPLERVDAVYDLVLALPLPLGSKAKDWRIAARTPGVGGALEYGGERVVLKRNVPLEAAWLPILAGAPSGLPDLSGTGHAWTLWDAIVRYDAAAGATAGGHGSFRYEAAGEVEPLDPGDPQHAAYLMNWIPTLEAVPPFAIRLDVAQDEE